MKFEFTPEFKTHPVTGNKAFQIRALCDFTTSCGRKVKKGDLGGYVSDKAIITQCKQSKWWVFEKGTIWGGTIWGGTIEGGTIRGGTIYGGTIYGGTIYGGTIYGGTIYGGTIYGGTIRGGTIWGGTIWGGTIYGGTIYGGTIYGGTIYGGTIWGGTIWGGLINSDKDFFVAHSVGSQFGVLTVTRQEDGGLLVNRGCWTGTLDAFKTAVKKRHKNSRMGKEYSLLLDYIEFRFSEEG